MGDARTVAFIVIIAVSIIVVILISLTVVIVIIAVSVIAVICSTAYYCFQFIFCCYHIVSFYFLMISTKNRKKSHNCFFIGFRTLRIFLDNIFFGHFG